MPFLLVLNGRDLPNAAGADSPLLFSFGASISLTDHAKARGGAMLWESPTQRIGIAPSGVTSSEADGGSIEIANIADEITSVGPLDHLLKWAFAGRAASIYRITGRSWASRVLCATGKLENPVDGDGKLIFALRDPRDELEAALQTTKFAGDNVAPDGVEGAADLKGKVKPVVYGTLSNWPGVKVNEQKLIWQLCDKAATVLCVRDGGVPLAASTSRANVASMLANAPPDGGYDYCSISTGTYVRFGSTPAYQVTFDVQEGATEPDRTHAQVWKRIRTERCGTDAGDISSASVTAVDVLADKEVGFAWLEDATRREAIDRVLASLSGYEVQDLTGEWSIGQLVAPSGTPALNLMMVREDSVMGPTDRALITAPSRARPSYAPKGAPPYRVNIRWGRNHTIMNAADFAGSAAQRLRDKFATEYRVETVTSTAVWNPSTGAGAFPNAPELTIDTGYQPGADGRTSPHTATEAARILALYGALPIKGQYETTFLPEPGDVVLPGTVIGLTYPRYDLDTGPLFVALQASWRVEASSGTEIASAGLVLGLQT
jgi:hypothetical protein